MTISSRIDVFSVLTVLLCLTQLSYGDYDCLCNYAVENSVFSDPDSSLTPIGYLYEFDCKPISDPQKTTNGYYIIQFQHQLAYMQSGDDDKLQVQTCAGSMPMADQLTTTDNPVLHVSNHTNRGQTTVVSSINTSTVGTPVDTTYTTGMMTPGAVKISTTLNKLNTVSTTNNASRLTSLVTSSVSSANIRSTSFTYNSTTHSSMNSTFSSTSSSIETKTIPQTTMVIKTNVTENTGEAFELTTESSLASHTNTKGSTSLPLPASNTTAITLNPLNTISTATNSSRLPSTSIVSSGNINRTSSATAHSSMTSMFSTPPTTKETNSIPPPTTGSGSNYSEITVKPSSMSTITAKITSTELQFTVAWTNALTETEATSTESTSPLIISTSTSIPSTKVSVTTKTTIPSTAPTTQLPVTTTEAPITWPSGTYGLMEAAQGCPDDGYVTWSEGWRLQDTEGLLPIVSPGNKYTFGIENYMKGEFAKNDMKTYFCMKTRHVSNAYDSDWPRGSYCVLKYGHCPKGFRSGSVFWDDVVLGNQDDKGGALPEGTFDTETEIFYCCRDDGPVSTSIVLPTARAFILLRYTETCQAVKGMSAYDIFIHWDDQNFFNSDRVTGMHPYDDGDGKNHKLHFCYYSSSSGSGTGPGLVGR